MTDEVQGAIESAVSPSQLHARRIRDGPADGIGGAAAAAGVASAAGAVDMFGEAVGGVETVPFALAAAPVAGADNGAIGTGTWSAAIELAGVGGFAGKGGGTLMGD